MRKKIKPGQKVAIGFKESGAAEPRVEVEAHRGPPPVRGPAEPACYAPRDRSEVGSSMRRAGATGLASIVIVGAPGGPARGGSRPTNASVSSRATTAPRRGG